MQAISFVPSSISAVWPRPRSTPRIARAVSAAGADATRHSRTPARPVSPLMPHAEVAAIAKVRCQGRLQDVRCSTARRSSGSVQRQTRMCGPARIPLPGLPGTNPSAPSTTERCRPAHPASRPDRAKLLVAWAALTSRQRRHMLDLHLRSLLHISTRYWDSACVFADTCQRSLQGLLCPAVSRSRTRLICRPGASVAVAAPSSVPARKSGPRWSPRMRRSTTWSL